MLNQIGSKLISQSVAMEPDKDFNLQLILGPEQPLVMALQNCPVCSPSEQEAEFSPDAQTGVLGFHGVPPLCLKTSQTHPGLSVMTPAQGSRN